MNADPTLAKTIGANIATERKSRKLSQGWLADKLGIGQSRLSNIEAGNSAPSVETLARIAEALDVPLLALIAGVGSTPDAYRKGYEDGWRACADDVEAHLTWAPRADGAR